LEIPDLPADWAKATALRPGEEKVSFTADSYHEFVDCPTVFAPSIKQLHFEEDGTDFHLHFQGEYGGDEKLDEYIIDMVRAIVKEQGAIFGGFPFSSYHFIYRLLPFNMRHAVEHSNSASFALPATVTQSKRQALSGLAGITAHEFMHAWNVKRIRPAALWPYDYSQPQYTRLHWFTEGVTDYYADLTLVRSGLIEEDRFWKSMAGTIQSLENDYAAQIVSPEAASFNSWLARTPYEHPDHRISYYTLGVRVGMLMDAELIRRSKGEQNLDDLFRLLYQTYYAQDRGVPENGIQQGLEKLTSDSWQDFFSRYVAGTEPVPYDELLEPFGLTLSLDPATQKGLRQWGITSSDKLNQGILIRKVHPGSDAFAAGLDVNDLLLEVDGNPALKVDFEKYMKDLKPGARVPLTIFRGGGLMKLDLTYEQLYRPVRANLSREERIAKKKENLYLRWLSSATSTQN
ncbi:MAG: PDZ domain-containing protein, partial [Bacteroidota bacterium]